MAESRKDFKRTPIGQQAYWEAEFASAKKRMEKFRKQGDKIVDIFLGRPKEEVATFKVNLFHSNVVTVSSLLYGNLPKIDVSRRFADANDDVGRVATVTMERLLNLDLADQGEKYHSVFEGCLQDRLLAGLGVARVRYGVEVDKDDNVLSESAPIDYYFWGDVMWGWSRNFADIPWIAFRSYMTADEIDARFGKKASKDVTMKKQSPDANEENSKESDDTSPWEKGEVWEVWDKTTKKVIWISIGSKKVLDTKKDPLQLTSFYPCPPFLMANATTSLYLPRADYVLAEDLYAEVDLLQSRIATITAAVKVVGVYDQAADSLARIFTEGTDNDLIPVDNWAMFAEKGGIKGQIDWLPIGEIVEALNKLIVLRDDTIAMLQQVTGMSDIMQGNLKNQYEGNAQSDMKARFGSVRIQQMQEQFAKFVSGLMQIKAEIISRHFDAKTIVQQSNMQFSPDKDFLPKAVQLIKSPEEAKIRVVVQPESLAMTDFMQLQSERNGFLNAISTFLQSSAPLMEQEPASKPFLLQILQWSLSGYKGSAEIEGVFDKAIAATEAENRNRKQEEDPSAKQAQAAERLEGVKLESDLKKIREKAQADMAVRMKDMEADIKTAELNSQLKIREIAASNNSKLTEIEASFVADAELERLQGVYNTEQKNSEIEGEMIKSEQASSLKITEDVTKTRLKLQEMAGDAEKNIMTAVVTENVTDDGDSTGAEEVSE